MVVCGRTAAIGSAVIAALKPEYEGLILLQIPLSPLGLNNLVTHFIQIVQDGVSYISSLLQGKPPADTNARENIGTHNYSQKAKAIILGGAFNDENIAEMRQACEGVNHVPWLRPNMARVKPPASPADQLAYAEMTVKKVKACLAELRQKGDLEKDGLYFY